MTKLKAIKQNDRQQQMNKAFKYGAKEGENNNPYKSIGYSMKAYKDSYKKKQNVNNQVT